MAQGVDILCLDIPAFSQLEELRGFGARVDGIDVTVIHFTRQADHGHLPLIGQVDRQDDAKEAAEEAGFQLSELTTHGHIQAVVRPDARD